jgi:hypothetical protein
MGILKGTADQITVKATAKISMGMGKVETLKFNVTYKRRDYDDAREAIRQINTTDSDVDTETVVRDDIVTWSGLDGDDGNPVEFNDENLDVMLAHGEYRLALFDAWGEAQLGRLLANSKN